MSHVIARGDARRLPLADRSVHCCVTSPPYYGLRDYGTATWVGGDPDCDHRSPTMWEGRDEDRPQLAGSAATNSAQLLLAHRTGCGKCGATKVDSQIGLEKTPEEFVATLVDVFREVKRVLRDDGTLWVSIGDSYQAGKGMSGGAKKYAAGTHTVDWKCSARRFGLRPNDVLIPGLKPKDLIGIPWMLAFALRADGWYLRSDVIWSKPNPMRESVRDRPTKSHEYLFLLSKRPRYFCDMEAIKVPCAPSSRLRLRQDVANQAGSTRAHAGGKTNGNMKTVGDIDTANKLSVWTVSTKGYKGAHFATFPPKLILPCVKAGTSERGCCPKCGAPWCRIVEKVRVATRPGLDTKLAKSHGHRDDIDPAINWRNSTLNYKPSSEVGNRDPGRHVTSTRTVGWESSCGCPGARWPIPCTVLDPFGGAFTTSLVAASLGRSSVGVELNPEYALMGRERLLASIREQERPHKPRPKSPRGAPRTTRDDQRTLFD